MVLQKRKAICKTIPQFVHQVAFTEAPTALTTIPAASRERVDWHTQPYS